MISVSDWVYYVSPSNGVTLEYVLVRGDGAFQLEYDSTGVVFDDDGYINISDLLPSFILSTVDNYHTLVKLYGDNVVPKPMVKLNNREFIEHLCFTRNHGVRCLNNDTNEIVKIFSVIVDVAVSNNHNYTLDKLTPVDDNNVPIKSVTKQYGGV